MKKFLSLLLALAMVLSLCSCGKKENDTPADDQNPAGNSQQLAEVGQSDDDSVEGEVSEPPDKVIGDRVLVGGEDGGPKHQPTGWEVGEVAPEEVFTQERAPLKLTDTKIDMNIGLADGSQQLNLVVVSYLNGETAMELETKTADSYMLTRMFDVDGQSYAFLSATYGGESDERLYKVVADTSEEDNSDEEIPVEGEGSGETDEGGAGTDAEAQESTDFELDPGTITSGFGSGNLDITDKDAAKDVQSCEYIGLKDGEDLFKVVMKNGQEYTVYIDHDTGWITGATAKVSKKDEDTGVEYVGVMDTHIEYNTKYSITMDVSGAEEDTEGNAAMFVFAQILSLVDLSSVFPASDMPDIEVSD